MSANRHIVAWISDLANLTTSTPLADAKSKITALAEAIANDFPIEAFTKESLYAISREAKYFPPHSVLLDLLGNWWSANKPRAEDISSEDPSLDERDRASLRSWLTTRHQRNEASLAQALSVERQYFPKVFAHICRTDVEAQRIAMHRGWLRDASENRERTDEERAYVRERAAEAIAAIRRQTAPIDWARIDAQRTAADAEMRRQQAEQWKPKPLSPEQLAEARKVAGIHADPQAAQKPESTKPETAAQASTAEVIDLFGDDNEAQSAAGDDAVDMPSWMTGD